MEVRERSAVALLGRNGMGKTATIRAIIGFNPPRKGEIRFNEKSIARLRSHEIAKMGIGLVPQGRLIFPSLSVEENLTVAIKRRGNKEEEWTLDKVYSLFPILRKRAKNSGALLSGGEQQMLTFGRALMTNPDLLLLDEPSEGLAPIIVQEISGVIKKFKNDGLSILLVEQNLPMALGIVDYAYVISKGIIVYESTPEELNANEDVKSNYIGVGRG